MARYLGPKLKLSRREGTDLGHKSGIRPISSKCKHESIPGTKPGQMRRGAGSNYSLQLREKQKVKRIYGILERQFRNYYKAAVRHTGPTGHNLLILLECRLDNAVYRASFASTRAQARQLVSHGHILVNDKKVDIPSYQLKAGDVVKLSDKAGGFEIVKISKEVGNEHQEKDIDWIQLTTEGGNEFTFTRLPERDELSSEFKESLIVELYSK